jgi:hypothetical protein
LVRTLVKRLYEYDPKTDTAEKLWKEVRFADPRVLCNMITEMTADIAPGETEEKRFNFVLPLPVYNEQLSSCFRGVNLDYFYELAVFVDGDKAHSMAIIMASGEDPTNRCPPIDMAAPYQGMLPGAYPRSVYPHGQVAGVVMPPQPPANIPQLPRPVNVARDVQGGGDIYGAQSAYQPTYSANPASLLDAEAPTFPDI